MCAILVAVAIAFMLPLFSKREIGVEDATREQNIAIAREQLADLENRLKADDIEQETYKATKDELERSLYADLKDAKYALVEKNDKSFKSIDTWLILLLVPIIAIPVYLNLGNLHFTKQLDSKKAAQEVAKATMPLKADGSPDIEKITQRLQLEMESNPTDPKGWYMLGRSYMLIQRFEDAVTSFEKSLSLRPDLAETMLSLADALSMMNTGQLIGRPRELVNKALTIEPENITALWLSGMAASQEGEYSEAIKQWQKVLPFIEDKPDEKNAVIGLIDEAKSRLSPELKNQLSNSSNQNKDAKSESIGIEVNISLSDSLER